MRTVDEGAGEVLYGLGAVGGRQGDELASLIYLRLALYLAPDNALATITLADIYERMKQEEAAIELYDSVPQNSPLRVNADMQAALLLETLGKSSEALGPFAGGRRGASQGSGGADGAGQSPAFAQAVRRIRCRPIRACSICSPSPRRASGCSIIIAASPMRRRKNWATAEADLKKALELFPDQPLVLNYLGYSWVDQGVNLDDAFKMLRRAVDLRARDGYVVDSLGWAYYRLGRYDEAVRELGEGDRSEAVRSGDQRSSRATPIGASDASSKRSSSGTTRATSIPIRTSFRRFSRRSKTECRTRRRRRRQAESERRRTAELRGGGRS